MADQKVYVSIDYMGYKMNKQDILYCQADLLKSLQHLQELRKIRKEKNNLKLKLARQLAELLKTLEEIKELFPTPVIPKGMGMHDKEELEFKEDKKELDKHNKQSRTIEQELREIQEKIKGLNK